MDPEVCPNCEKVVYDAEGFPAGKFYESKKFFHFDFKTLYIYILFAIWMGQIQLKFISYL